MKATLPKPPGVNHIYGITSKGGFAREYITKKGADWFATAKLLIKSQIHVREPIDANLEVFVWLYTCRHQDIDNILKPVLDLLTKSDIIKDDSLITHLDARKIKVAHIAEEKVEVEIKAYI